uniref:Uncharacterized protein n=1 Tax=Lygus hesperus TaxID=30085 RepID=A0A146L5D1_LYGHE
MSWVRVKQEPEELDPLLINEDEVFSTPANSFSSSEPVPNVAQPQTSTTTNINNYQPPHKQKTRENLNRQSRAIVANVQSYMEREKAAMGFLVEPTKAQTRTTLATGVGKTTVRRIMMESRKIQNNFQDDFKNAGSSRSRIAPYSGIELNDTEACRTLLFKSILDSDSHRSMNCIAMHKKFVAAKLFSGGKTSFRRFLVNLNFQIKRTRNFGKQGKCTGSRSIIMEKHDTQYKKFVYLRDLKQYKAEGRKIIFTAITKLARAHCKADKGQQPTKDGKVLKITNEMFTDVPEELAHEQWRAVLLGAGDESGFVTGGFLIWRCIKKLGANSYDENANYKKYVNWVKGNLIPNIPEGAVVVLDHEAIYDRHEDPIPTHCSDKEDMKAWLKRKGIDFESEAAKVELYELVRKNKQNHSKYEIDSILEKAGHPVMRIPPNYNELNPMFVMLKEVKTWMKGQAPNVNPRFVDIAKLTVSKMLTTPTESWKTKVDKCQATADKYFSYQAPMEKKISETILANHGCIDSESEENDASDSNEEIEASSSEESEEETTNHRTSNADPNLWVTPLPSVFMAGDDFGSTTDPQPTLKRNSAEKTQKVKRQKIGDSYGSQEPNEWKLDGMVTV